MINLGISSQATTSFELKVKKNDHRYFEISPFSNDKFVNFTGSLIESLKNTKNYIAIANSKLISIHTSKSTDMLAKCSFFEVGHFQGSFFNYSLRGEEDAPRSILICLKTLESTKKSKHFASKISGKNEDHSGQRTQISITHIDESTKDTLKISQRLKCDIPFLDTDKIKDFVFTYKGGLPRAQSTVKSPSTSQNSQKSSQNPPKAPQPSTGVVNIGVFLEQINYQKRALTMTMNTLYLSYDFKDSSCKLKEKEYTFRNPYGKTKENFNYRVVDHTIFFFEKSEVPMTGKQVLKSPLLLYHFPSSWENPKKLKSGRFYLNSRRIIEVKSSFDVAELAPHQPFLVLMGQSDAAIITISKFEYNKDGVGFLGPERRLGIPSKLAEVSDTVDPILFIIKVTIQKDLLIFSQDVRHQKLVIRYCRFTHKSKIPKQSTTSTTPSSHPPQSEAKKPDFLIFLHCSIKYTKIDIVGVIDPISFFMKESSHIGNLASFDFADREGTYVYTANIFYFYPKKEIPPKQKDFTEQSPRVDLGRDNENLDNLKFVSTFNKMSRLAVKKRNLAVYDSRWENYYVETLSSYFLGYGDSHKILFWLKKGAKAVPVLDYHHRIFKYLEENNLDRLKFTLVILPSSTQDLLPGKRTLGALMRQETMRIEIQLIQSCLSDIEYFNPASKHLVSKDTYVGELIKVESKFSKKMKGSLVGFSLDPPNSDTNSEKTKKIENAQNRNFARKRLGKGDVSIIKNGTYLNFNMLKSNKVNFFYPKSIRNVVVDDIYFTGQFIFGVASKFSLFPMICHEHLVQQQSEYERFSAPTKGMKVINKYSDQTFYEFSYVMSCEPQPAFSNIDFSRLQIHEMKASKYSVVLHCKNISASHGSFLFVAPNKVSIFSDRLIRLPFYDHFDRYQVVDVDVAQDKKLRDGGRLRMEYRLIHTSLIFFHRSEKLSNDFKTKADSVVGLHGEGLTSDEKSRDFVVRAVLLEASQLEEEERNEFPKMMPVKITNGLEYAKGIRCLKKVVFIGQASKRENGENEFGYNLFAIFGCQKSSLMAMEIFISTFKLERLHLSLQEPYPTRVGLAKGIDLKYPVWVCLTRRKNMLFYQTGMDRVVGKDLDPNLIRNNYDFDLELFGFSRILRMVCVPEFEVGVVIGEIEVEVLKNDQKVKQKGMGFVTLKLRDMEDFHDRLFDYFTLDFIPLNLEEDIRVYPVVTDKRDTLIIMVKYMREFYTRKLLLDGPDLYVTPRNESISESLKSSKKENLTSAKFQIVFYLNNSEAFKPWGVDLQLKTGFDKLTVKAEGYQLEPNETLSAKVGNSKQPPNDLVSAVSASVVIPAPFYKIHWKKIFFNQLPRFNPDKSYELDRLVEISGHVTKISIQKSSSIVGLGGLGGLGETPGLATRASELLMKVHFNQERLNLLRPKSLDLINRLKLDLNNDPDFDPGLLRFKLTTDPTGTTPYLAAWWLQTPLTTKVIWYSPTNFKQYQILSISSARYYRLVNTFDFFVNKHRVVYVLLHNKTFKRPESEKKEQNNEQIIYQTPIFIFSKIAHSEEFKTISTFTRNVFYVLYGTGPPQAVAHNKHHHREERQMGWELTFQDIKERVLFMKTWDAKRNTKRLQLIFTLMFKKAPESKKTYIFEHRRYTINLNQNDRHGSADNPRHWFGQQAMRYSDVYGYTKAFFFFEVNAKHLRHDSRLPSSIREDRKIQIFYFEDALSEDGIHKKKISTSHGTRGKEAGRLSTPKVMQDEKKVTTADAEIYEILMPNDCKEIRALIVSCVQVSDEHSAIEVLYYEVIVSSTTTLVYLKLLDVKKYIKHQRARNLKIRQGFKFFAVLVNPPKTEEAGLYVYKKQEYGGSIYVYYFLALEEFFDLKDYGNVNFYFESGEPVRHPHTAIVDYNETLVIYSPKKNIFLKYNLTDFEVGFEDDAKRDDLDGYELVVRNAISSRRVNFSSLFQVEKKSSGSSSGSGGVAGEKGWLGILFMAIGVCIGMGLIPLLCYLWEKRKVRLEDERVIRDEDIIYDLDDFRF